MNSTASAKTRPHRLTPPTFPAHVAARIEADWEGDRLPIPGPRKPTSHAGDSDPNADELLKRARQSRPAAALLRLEVEAAYLERDAQAFAAYNEWADGAAA